MGWPRDTTSFPEPTWWNGDDNRDWETEPDDDQQRYEWETGMLDKIRTEYWCKPMPIRSFDWSAVLVDYEPNDPVGYGRTEEEAINDLLSQLNHR